MNRYKSIRIDLRSDKGRPGNLGFYLKAKLFFSSAIPNMVGPPDNESKPTSI